MSLADDQFRPADYLKAAEKAIGDAKGKSPEEPVARIEEPVLPATLEGPAHVHAAICELLKKRDSMAQEVKRLETICDGLIRDVAERAGCPLEQYSYNLQDGTLEKN